MERVLPPRGSVIALRRALAQALLLPLLFCGAAAAAGTSWRESLDRAERLSAEGKDAQAAAAAQEALADADKSLGPDAPEIGRILARLARLYRKTGDGSRLPGIEARLAALKSKDFEGWLALGMILREEDKLADAEKALKTALALRPDDPDAENELSRDYDEAGRFEEEVPLLKKLVAGAPDDYLLYRRLARVDENLGRFAEARETYALSRRINGKTAAAYIEEGYFYQNSDDVARAQEAFQNAVVVDTASYAGYHHLGSFLSARRRYPEAETSLRRALKILEADPNALASDFAHTSLFLGQAVAAQGRLAEAEAVLLRGLEKTSADDDLHAALLNSLADLYVSKGDNARAEEVYKRSAAACGARAESDCRFWAARALIGLGRLYLVQGRRADAETAAERAEKACEDVPIGAGLFPIGHGRLPALRELAGLYGSLGASSRLEALYARLAAMRPTMPFNPDLVWVETGMARQAAAKGRLREAERRYREAIQILDHNGNWKKEADVLDRLAAVCNDLADARAAEEARRRARSLRERP
jgi:tetratricopeptide (TPR) repeat protein